MRGGNAWHRTGAPLACGPAAGLTHGAEDAGLRGARVRRATDAAVAAVAPLLDAYRVYYGFVADGELTHPSLPLGGASGGADCAARVGGH